MEYHLGVKEYTNEQYHASDGLSRSKLWKFKQLPYKYWYEYLSGEYTQNEDSRAMIMGNLVHTVILEPELFNEHYCIKPKFINMPLPVLLKDVGKEQYEQIKAARASISADNNAIKEEFERDLKSKLIVTEAELELTNAMRCSFFSNQEAIEIIFRAKIEKSIYWKHEPTGLICKARPDIWNGGVVADLKTTADAGRRAFQSSAHKYGYFLQAAMIYEALKSIGEPFKTFVFICIEKSAPHALALYMLDDEALQYGIDMFHSLMNRLAECYEKDRWPDYGVSKLTIPSYATLESEYEYE